MVASGAQIYTLNVEPCIRPMVHSGITTLFKKVNQPNMLGHLEKTVLQLGHLDKWNYNLAI